MKTVNEEKESGWREIWRNLQSKPSTTWILLGLIGLGIVLLISGNDQVTQREMVERLKTKAIEDNPVEIKPLSDEQRLERELTETLKRIAGVGEVRVDVNLRAGNRKTWERQARTSKRVSQEQGVLNTEENNSDELVFAKDGSGRDSPVLKEELAPEIEGVIVVADGAADSHIRELLTETVTTILGLPAHRVLIIPGKY